MGKHHFGRLLRTKGRARSDKERSDTSDSSEKRFSRKLRLEEEQLMFDERIKVCGNEFDKRQAALDVKLSRRETLRAKDADSSTISCVSMAVVPLSASSLATMKTRNSIT